jgi:DNA-binding CsgD family transcriptional regulator
MKDTIITAILIILMLTNGADVFIDLSLSMPLWHVAQESFLMVLSGVGAFVLIIDMRRRTKTLKGLAQNLSNANKQIESLHNKFTEERRHFSHVIQRQFMEWNFTPTEQEVAFLLLKGLSLKEIASVRDTKEATVRQQASNVYTKSNLSGRHEFSAWFLEDFLHVS